MKPFSKHLSLEMLADYVDARLDAAQSAAADRHLNTCEACRTTLGSMQRMVAALRRDELAAAPPYAIARALQLFRPPVQPRAAQPQRPSLLGLLRFDSGLTPAIGMRSGPAGQAVRQLFFNVGEFDLDVRIESRGEEWLLAGQLLGGEAAGSADLSGAEQRYRSELNDLGEFSFAAVAPGIYQLLIALPAVDLVIPELRVGD